MDLHSLVVKLKELESELGHTPTRQQFIDSGISDHKLRKITYGDILNAAGLVSSKYKSKEIPESITRVPKILYFDIESIGMEVKTYSLKVDYISPRNILKDWSLLSYAAMFEGEDKIYYLDQRYAEDKRDDRQLIEGLHAVLSSADIVVGHNSDSFDLKKFNTRAAKYNLDPLPDFTKYDTLKMLRRTFALSSNALWYVAKFFNLENAKSEHGKFPGDMLWDECMKGNIEAWVECELYNKQDVMVTQELFKYLVKYDSRINYSSFFQKATCSCGGKEFFKDGYRFLKQGRFQKYRCRDCKKPFLGKENLIDKDIRKGFFK